MSTTELCIRYGLNLDNFGRINLQISRLMDDPGSDISDFINAIRFNRALSVEIINIVNKGYSGFTGEIQCLTRAIKLLGISQLHQIVNYLAESTDEMQMQESSAETSEYNNAVTYLQAG